MQKSWACPCYDRAVGMLLSLFLFRRPNTPFVFHCVFSPKQPLSILLVFIYPSIDCNPCHPTVLAVVFTITLLAMNLNHLIDPVTFLLLLLLLLLCLLLLFVASKVADFTPCCGPYPVLVQEGASRTSPLS